FRGRVGPGPPAYSAAKVTGRRAYDLAREGRGADLAARRVQIHEIVVERYAYPELEVTVRCGKGTYIRSLARDLGERLGCGACVQTLRRLCVGPFTTDNAVSLDASVEEARGRLLPPGEALAELPRVTLGPRQAETL